MKSKEQDDHYHKYLALMHAKLVTPDEVIKEIVKEGSGRNLVTKTRIVAGEVNEVYDVELENNQHVILRIAKNGYPNFLQEKWAIEKVSKLGVPTPKILLIKHFKVGEDEKSACLMKKVDGEPLERGSIEFDKLDLKLGRQLINQAGEILSKIHSIETRGFGWIVGKGQAIHKTSDELIDELLNQQEKFEKVALEENLGKDTVQKVLDIIRSFKPAYSKVKPHLNHGDYGHKHFMVKDNKIVAILDWGGIRSDTLVYDFAWWDYWSGDYIPTEWLKEGYLDKSIFDNNFEDFLHLLRLFRGLETVAWYHQKKYKPAIGKAKAKLRRDLRYFS